MAQGIELVNQIFPLHSPKNANVGDELDEIRGLFQALALRMTEDTVGSPEQTLAIRATHAAMQAWIMAVVLYQEGR